MHLCKKLGNVSQLYRKALFIGICITLALIVHFFCVPIVGAQTELTGPIVKVTITVDGQNWEWSCNRITVGALLRDAGVHLNPKDEVFPSLDSTPQNGMNIRVVRVEHRTVVQKEFIMYDKVTKFNPKASARRVTQQGKRGEKEVAYLVTYKDGEKFGHKVLSSRVLSEPVEEILVVNNPKQLTSRGGAPRSMRMVATAYDPGPRSCGKWADGRTAIGLKAGFGVVAVDPRVIPMRTKLYIEGYGMAIAGDVGGAIKGNRIDLGFDTYAEAIRFGRRTVTVYILD